jgi:cysteine desulfurase
MPGRPHLVTAATEHHSVLHPCRLLQEQFGAQVTYVPVDAEGRVDPETVRRAIRPETCLVSIMAANNEIGTLAPLTEIAAVTRAAGVPFHTDAVQIVGSCPVNVEALGVDLLTLSAHKFYGPKGVGALFLRRGIRLKPLLSGGGQERGRRAGTENVTGIVGMARALELAQAEMEVEAPRQAALRDRLWERLQASMEGVDLNGHPTQRLPNILNVAFRGIESEVMLLNLDLEGVAASAGSACTAGSLEPSHVVAALGWPPERVNSSVRFSLGRATTEAEIDATVEIVARICHRLR